MALIKMATLSPAMPVSELLRRLSELESHPPSPVMAAEPPGAPYRPVPPGKQPPHSSSPAPAEIPPAVQPAAPEATTAVKDWPGFVAFVKTRKPLLATKLEKGSPLETADGVLRLGYPKGTIELSMLQETDSLQQLAELATAFFGKTVTVKIVALNGNEQSLPPSLEEKKTAESARNEQTMRNTADSHPLVKAAIEIFGGKIVAYKQ
jgi:DNA polymerase-3 subunit gamma/tau